MNPSRQAPTPGQGQLVDIIYFLLINLVFLFLSAILWNIIWIKKHGGKKILLNLRHGADFKGF